MTQIGPRFTARDDRNTLQTNRTDYKVNLSAKEGVATQTVVEDLRGALATGESQILMATDLNQATSQVSYLVLTPEEATELLGDLENQLETRTSITLGDLTFPESVQQRHASAASNQTAQTVHDLYGKSAVFNLKLSAVDLKNNAIHLDQHYASKQGAVAKEIKTLDTQLAVLQTRIGTLETSGENPEELTTLQHQHQLLTDMRQMLGTQQEILTVMSGIKYSWNNRETNPETLTQLDALAQELEAQANDFQAELGEPGLALDDPRLSAQFSLLADKAEHMAGQLADCVDFCQDPEMMSARTVVGKELNLNAVMRDYENTLDLIEDNRRKAPAGMPQETPDLQGFKNSTLNDRSYSQSFQKIFTTWNAEISRTNFQAMLEAPDADKQLQSLRAAMSSKIDRQFRGPDGYVIAVAKVNQVKKLFDDHIMAQHAQALAQRAGEVGRPSQIEVQQNINNTRFGEPETPFNTVVADNLRVELTPSLATLQTANANTPAQAPKNTALINRVTHAVIDNHTAKQILPTLTGVVPEGFGTPAQSSMQTVHAETQSTITATQGQIKENHGNFREHYKAGSLTLDALPSEVRQDLEADFLQHASDADLSLMMSLTDWPPIPGVRSDIVNFAQAYDQEVRAMLTAGEPGTDEHTFLACMKALELYQDPKYKDQIDIKKLDANIAALQTKLAPKFQACEQRAMTQTFGDAAQRAVKAGALKESLLSANFAQRLSMLPASEAQTEMKEAMQLLHMLNPQEDLSAISGQLLKSMVTQNPIAVMSQLPAETQSAVLDQSLALFEKLDPETQNQIVQELETALGIVAPESDAVKDALKYAKNQVKPVSSYAKILEVLKKEQNLIYKLKHHGALGATSGLLTVATLGYTGLGLDMNTASGLVSALGSTSDFVKVLNKIGTYAGHGGELIAMGAKTAKFLKAMGPLGDAISTYTTARDGYNEYVNGDYTGATLKGIGAAASGAAAIAGTYALCVASSGPAAPVVAIAGGIVALAAWGLDEAFGESDQETIIRQAGCQRASPPPSTRYEDYRNNPMRLDPGKI